MLTKIKEGNRVRIGHCGVGDGLGKGKKSGGPQPHCHRHQVKGVGFGGPKLSPGNDRNRGGPDMKNCRGQ